MCIYEEHFLKVLNCSESIIPNKEMFFYFFTINVENTGYILGKSRANAELI